MDGLRQPTRLDARPRLRVPSPPPAPLRAPPPFRKRCGSPPRRHVRPARSEATTDWYGRASKTLVSRLAQNITNNSGSLTSLHLVGMYTWAAVWMSLLASEGGGGGGVRLTDLTRDEPTPELLGYLASYAGVRLHPAGKTQADTDRFADTFFGSVLPCLPPRRARVSRVLRSQWSFGAHPHRVDAICALRNMECLTMSVSAAEVPHVVTLLLHTAARLPSLASLTIPGVISRSSKCGTHENLNLAMLHTAIQDAVRAFRSRIPSAAVLRVGVTWYELLSFKSSGESVEGEADEMQRELLAYSV